MPSTERITERERAVRDFFARESGALARACHAMARAFARGGTLIAFGSGPAATDAAHAAVEFLHPVIVGKRALPALAPGNDPTSLSTLAQLARPDDIALALSHHPGDPAFSEFLDQARSLDLLTIAFTAAVPAGDRAVNGGHRSTAPEADHLFAVPGDDPDVVQEVQETAYHVLWELVHVFFDQPGLVEEDAADACITCGDVAVTADVVEARGVSAVIERDGAREQVATELVEDVQVGDRLLCHAGVALEKVDPEPTGFLYPFLGGGTTDLDGVLDEVESSTLQKAEQVIGLRRQIDLEAVSRCGADIQGRLEAGGRLIAFGNGGSATDAQDLAADALARGWSAIALGNDPATVTAVANDVGFDQVYARQLVALARPGDVAVAISTSGGSANLIAAMEETSGLGILTVAIAGHDGGRLAEVEGLDHLFVVPSDHIPRIQEVQATICHLLLDQANR